MGRLIHFTMSAAAVAGVAFAAPQLATAQEIIDGPKQVTPRLSQQLQKESQIIQLPAERRIRAVPDMTLFNDLEMKPVSLGKYWIGLNCVPVSAALRSQLKLPEGQGLLVKGVPDETPAKKAGLQPHDVLVKAGKKPVGSVQDLINAIQKGNTAELSIELIRGGKPTTVTIKPAERPKEQQGLIVRIPQSSGIQWYQNPRQGITVVEPGVVIDRPYTQHVPRQATQYVPVPATQYPQYQPKQTTYQQRYTTAYVPKVARRAIPNGVSISITRRGGKPTEIHVERQGDKWNVGESEIDQLPEELRNYVRSMLNSAPATYAPTSGPFGNRIFIYKRENSTTTSSDKKKPSPPKAVTPGPTVTSPVESEIEKLKRELSEEMKQLRKAIDELKKSNESK
jgi:membrane-associated protease RseP (regulator of RpoE activity)